VEGISVESAGCSQGACGQRREPTGYHRDFPLIQITSTLTDQYSVLVIHAVSFRSLGPLSGPNLFKRVGGAGKDAAWSRLTAFVEISIDGAGCCHAAFCRRPEPAAYLLDFLLSHVTGAPANQYSVLVIHVFSPFVIGSVERARVRQKKFSRRECYTSAPHSLLKVSPSALAFFEVGAVQSVAVRTPPPTCSTSCSLKARAPLRANTLFWSFMFFSLPLLGPLRGPSSSRGVVRPRSGAAERV
jgi:hypothetical protein